MNDRKVIFNNDARKRLVEGVNILANAVRETLGPHGKNVIIDRFPRAPQVTKDGVTVAKDIQIREPFRNLGAQMLKEASSKSEDKSADGTTTTVVLAQILINKAMTFVDDGKSSVDIKKGIDIATKEVLSFLNDFAKEIGNDYTKIEQVATVSANGDGFIGKLISDTIKEVGFEGGITVEERIDKADTIVEVVKGVSFGKGYEDTSANFINDKKKMLISFENARVFITDQKIKDARTLETILGEISQEIPLLIIAPDYSDDALTILATNKIRNGVKVAAIKAPGFNEHRTDMMNDIAAITGGVLFNADYSQLHNPELQFCGTAENIIIDRNNTIIQGGSNANEERIEQRVNDARSQLKEANIDKYERTQIEDRLAKLTGGVAVIKVGGTTEVEMKELKDRIDDAVGATRSAIEEGIVPGGGVTLIRALQHIEGLQHEKASVNIGIDIMREALEQPLKQILLNTGLDNNEADKVIKQVKGGVGDYGYNAREEHYNDLYKDGVIDPKKVTRVAIENATSIAGLLITTECAIADDLDFDR